MTIPREIRDEVKSRLWAAADELDWASLSHADKSRLYTQWTESKDIGRVLAGHMDARAVRVYIKDTLLKAYSREKLENHRALVLRLLGKHGEQVVERWIKPHCLKFDDASMVAWGRADDWKIILGTLFERSFEGRGANAIVLFESAPRYMSPSSRALVEDAARRLEIERCVWFD